MAPPSRPAFRVAMGTNGPKRPAAARPGQLPLADLEDHGVYRKSVVMNRKRSGLGRCRHFFWLGVVFDTVGVAMLFVGTFAELIFYDMLLYMGSIIIFLSLLWWVSWYTGNIELPEETFGLTSQLDSSNMVSALQQSVSHRFSWSMGTLSNSLLRIRRQRQRRRSWRTLQRTAAPGMTGTGQLEQQQEQEAEGDRDSDHCQAFCQGTLSSTPEDQGSSESFGPPGPDSGPPWFDRQPLPHLVPPVLPLSTLDQPLPSAVSFSTSQPVVPLVSSTQSPAFSTYRSHCVISVASQSHLQVPVTSESQPVSLAASQSCLHLPGASQTHHLAPMDSQSHPLAPVYFQSHTLLPVASQSHLQVPVTSKSQPLPSAASQCHLQIPVSSQSQSVVPVASQRQLRNFPLVSGPQPPPVQASGTQAVGTQVPVVQHLSDQAFQTVDPADSETGRALLLPRQATESTSVVQEISLCQALPVPEAPKEPLAQAFETTPLPGQSPDTMSPVSEAAPPATPVQPFVPTETSPAPEPKKKSHSV